MSTPALPNHWGIRAKLGLIILLCLFVLAAPITHANGTIGCSANELITAIHNANTNPGADVLELSAQCTYTLTAVDNTDPAHGPNGLPVISSDITINGNDATIARDANASAFRLLQINAGSTLTLNQLTLTGGDAGATADKQGQHGGTLFNLGTCHLNYVTISNSHAGDGIAADLDDYNAGAGGHGGGLYNQGTVTLDHTTFHDNRAGSAAYSDYLQYGATAGGHGGAIYNDGNLTGTQSAFTTNATVSTPGSRSGGRVGDGGAIYNLGVLNLDATTFSNNSTGNGGGYMTGNRGSRGGAIYNTGKAILTASTFSNNLTGSNSGESDDSSGGAVYNDTTGELTLEHSPLQNNQTGSGGVVIDSGREGGYGGAIGNRGEMYISNAQFQNNATGGGATAFHQGGMGGKGGGIFNTGTLELSDSTFTDNTTGKGGGSPCCTGDGGPGGGIANAGTLTIERSTFFKNHTGDGGDRQTIGTNAGDGGSGAGIDNTGTATIVNSTFTENITGQSGILDWPQTNVEYDPRYGHSGSGGGIANHATLTLRHVTLSENGVGARFYLGQGSALANLSGTTNVQNTILANSIRGKNCGGTLIDGGGNVRFPKTDQTCVGTFADPKLEALQNNDGATQTMALAPNSRAINAALNANCPATDQRGMARPQGKFCDSGAFELEPPQGLTLTSPPDKARVKPSDIHLLWSATERVAYYRLTVRQDAPDGKTVISKKLTGTHFTPPFIQTGHRYYWRVKACSRVSCISTPWWNFRLTQSESELSK